MSFYEWWVEEFGHPPLPEEADVYAWCRKAYEQGWEDAKLLEQSESGNDSVPQR